jgi:TrmH family RNA methyltransferase
MGAVFRVPYTVVHSVAEFLSEHKELNSYAAVVDSDASSVTEIGFTEPCVAVIGNEGNGLKPETVESCDKKITIPMKGRAESLNASIAAGIIIWEMVK